LSRYDGWTETIAASCDKNFPKAYGNDVFPVPEIPSKIIIFEVARPAKNAEITCLL